jgi:hypothetical protein
LSQTIAPCSNPSNDNLALSLHHVDLANLLDRAFIEVAKNRLLTHYGYAVSIPADPEYIGNYAEIITMRIALLIKVRFWVWLIGHYPGVARFIHNNIALQQTTSVRPFAQYLVVLAQFLKCLMAICLTLHTGAVLKLVCCRINPPLARY